MLRSSQLSLQPLWSSSWSLSSSSTWLLLSPPPVCHVGGDDNGHDNDHNGDGGSDDYDNGCGENNNSCDGNNHDDGEIMLW